MERRLSRPEPHLFRHALSRFATGVVIVTAMLDEAPYGITVNAFTSVSLTPPLILVCVRRGSRLLTALARSTAFAVNVLSEDQAHLAHFFARAGRVSGPSAFAGVDVEASPLGSPLITGAIAHLDCRLYGTRDGGDHVICIGEVSALACTTQVAPLLFADGRFAEVVPAWPGPDAAEPLAWPWT